MKINQNDFNFARLEFVSDKQHHIVSNKVGANKLARQAAQQWIRDELTLLS